MTDWKSIAQKRLRQLRDADTWRENMRGALRHHLYRALAITLHARCIGDSNRMAAEIADDVAQRLTDK
mgnify:CR=1 FL=1